MKEIKKQFFLIHSAGNNEIDFGIIHMSEDELEEAVEGRSDGDFYEYIKTEFGLGNFDSWTHIEGSSNSADKLFFLASAIANEVGGETKIVNYLVDILEKHKELSDDNKRNLLEEVGAISKNL